MLPWLDHAGKEVDLAPFIDEVAPDALRVDAGIALPASHPALKSEPAAGELAGTDRGELHEFGHCRYKPHCRGHHIGHERARRDFALRLMKSAPALPRCPSVAERRAMRPSEISLCRCFSTHQNQGERLHPGNLGGKAHRPALAGLRHAALSHMTGGHRHTVY